MSLSLATTLSTSSVLKVNNSLTSGTYYLPEKTALTHEFMSVVINGTKSLLLVSQLKTITLPPKVEGLRMATLWAEVQQDKELMRYFPAYHGRVPSKAYFFNVGSKT